MRRLPDLLARGRGRRTRCQHPSPFTVRCVLGGQVEPQDHAIILSSVECGRIRDGTVEGGCPKHAHAGAIVDIPAPHSVCAREESLELPAEVHANDILLVPTKGEEAHACAYAPLLGRVVPRARVEETYRARRARCGDDRDRGHQPRRGVRAPAHVSGGCARARTRSEHAVERDSIDDSVDATCTCVVLTRTTPRRTGFFVHAHRLDGADVRVS
mmetsp:Transcript_29525/g.79313  ORF Transcript_29525/g.79313 Transcript_29525/m.79313 type:complete len:214 (-) Transcript_29525:495-1136(-)